MKVYSVNDGEFSAYGKVLQGYDFSRFSQKLSNDKMPWYGFYYVSADKDLEKDDLAEELKNREFGGFPIQIGFVKGVNKMLNCLEYHKSSEINIALDDVVLILGKQTDIHDGKYDLKNCQAFLLPAGMGVELYAGTLHYAPLTVQNSGYRIICVLPKGTNAENPAFDTVTSEDRMLGGCNKWVMAHPYCEDARNGVYVGLIGHKIIANILEF